VTCTDEKQSFCDSEVDSCSEGNGQVKSFGSEVQDERHEGSVGYILACDEQEVCDEHHF